MGRIIIADETIEVYVDNLLSRCQKKMGIIIGQVTNQKDFALALAVTPDDEANGANVAEKAARVPGQEHSRSHDIDLGEMDSQWLATHAHQVNRMLVGGMDVIGVFVSADQQSLVDHHDNLKQSVYAVFKRLSRAVRRPPDCEFNTERLLMLVNTTTKKVMCRTYDVKDLKSQSSPAELRYQALKDKWIQLESHLTVDIDVAFDKSLDTQLLNKKIQSSISPLCKQIEQSTATINQQLCTDNDTPLQTLCKGTKSTEAMLDLPRDLTKATLEVDLFTDHSATRYEVTNSITEECSSKLSMCGSICGRAYVHAKATFQEAVDAMKIDLVRSLMARCELLSEDIEITEGEAAYMQFYKPPSRVFAQPPEFPVCFCDYAFADEEPQEVVERLSELLDITVPVTGLDLTCERYPDDIDIPESLTDSHDTKMSGHSLIHGSLASPHSTDDTTSQMTMCPSQSLRPAFSRVPSLKREQPSYTGTYIVASAVVAVVIAVLLFYLNYT